MASADVSERLSDFAHMGSKLRIESEKQSNLLNYVRLILFQQTRDTPAERALACREDRGSASRFVLLVVGLPRLIDDIGMDGMGLLAGQCGDIGVLLSDPESHHALPSVTAPEDDGIPLLMNLGWCIA
jgi:hypothetical protein